MFQFVFGYICCGIFLANAVPIVPNDNTQVAYVSPVGKTEEVEHYQKAHYQFSYNVQDPLTGDSKSHYEQREGDVVRGSYSLIDPDGMKRTVEYTADPVHGFRAVVHREPVTGRVPVPVAKIAYATKASNQGYNAIPKAHPSVKAIYYDQPQKSYQ